MARVFVTRLLEGAPIERLRELHDVDMWPQSDPPPRARLLEGARTAEGMLCTLSDAIDAELLDAAPGLRVVSNLAVGYDNIDVAAAAARGIAVGNTPGVLTDATADLAFALLLAAARRLGEAEREVRAGGWGPWRPDWLVGADVGGTTLGIVGLGAIGRAVARRAEGFGMEVIVTTRSGGVTLEELLVRSDHVSLHVPLTEQTRGLIDATALARMKPTATLVNTARGGIVDTEALRVALTAGTIGAAGLDVTDPEPLPPQHPLLQAPNLFVTPHVGSASVRARAGMVRLAVENLLAGIAGTPLPARVAPEQAL